MDEKKNKIRLLGAQKTAEGIRLRVLHTSRKRFIGAAMFFGCSAREAREMAGMVRENGLSYRQGVAALLWSMEADKKEPDKEVLAVFEALFADEGE